MQVERGVKDECQPSSLPAKSMWCYSEIRHSGRSGKLRFGDAEFEELMRLLREGVREATGNMKIYNGSHVEWA